MLLHHRIAPLLGALALGVLAAHTARAQSPRRADSSLVLGVNVSNLSYRFIGPQGNRVSAVIGEPGNWNVYYIGAASGGVWKSIDGGINWRPVFDRMPAQSIGALAMAPSDHNVVWAGTGESFIRSNISLGNGVYKSTDAGRTWTHMGLDKTGRISRIVIDPQNPDIVLVAALGTGYGPQQERGVYRTTDGGKSWKRVLFVNENTGASDLAMDPVNPRILFAGMWQFVIHTWGKYSGGKGSGVYMSRDEGVTWKRVTSGLPKFPVGKVAVAIAPSDPDRVYALIETGGRGSLWRSENGGNSFHVVSYSHMLAERPHYYTRMIVSPRSENEIYFPSNSMLMSLDGGETAREVPWGGDNHDMWADPTNGDRMMIGFDGGAMITTNHGRSWNDVVLPIAQMYHVAVDNQVPYFVYGNEQDYASVRGPSNSLEGGRIPSGLWQTTAGCESGFSIPDPVDNNIVWGGCYEGGLERYDLRTRHARSVNPWPDEPLDSPGDSVKYRWNWTFPIAISPEDHNTVYVGSQYVHRTTDGGQSWTVISPDLTTNDTSKLGPSGGLSPDNLGVEYFSTLFAIAESPLQKGVIWTGSNDGLVQVTRDGGAHWTNVTANISGLPKWGTISNIEPSRFDAGTAYISVDFHQVNNFDPFIYKTSDYGKTWKLLSGGIPKSVFSYVHVVREDSKRKGMLYAGTENGIYLTYDDGAHWYPLQANLPHAPVTWLAIQDHFDDLVVSTSGRGVWILDDLGPLRELDEKVAAAQSHLFAMRPAYRFMTVNRFKTAPNDQSDGRNPRYGADINYLLAKALADTSRETASGAKQPARGAKKSAPDSLGTDTGSLVLHAPSDSAIADTVDSARAVRDSALIIIANAAGQVVRTMHGPGARGINRAYWDLRYDRTKEVELRTTPPGYPHIWEDKRFIGKHARPVYHYGIQEPKLGPLAPPGTYTVSVVLRGDTLRQPLTVLKDPHSAGSDADAQAGAALAIAVHDDIDTVVTAINRIERVRMQLEDLHDLYGADTTKRALLDHAKALDGKLSAVEDQFLQRRLQEDDQKTYRAPMELYTRLLYLEGIVGSGAGDIAGNPDFPPTAQDIAVHDLLRQRLQRALHDLQQVLSVDVPGFAAATGVGLVVGNE